MPLPQPWAHDFITGNNYLHVGTKTIISEPPALQRIGSSGGGHALVPATGADPTRPLAGGV